MPGFKIKNRYDILTPGDKALVFKLSSYPGSPYLLTKSTRYCRLLHLGPKTLDLLSLIELP